MKINKQAKIFFIFYFWTRQGLTLVLRIFIKENHGSRSSNYRICLLGCLIYLFFV